MPRLTALVWSIWYTCESGNLKEGKKVRNRIRNTIRNTSKELRPAVFLTIAGVENRVFMVQVKMKYIAEAIPNEYQHVDYILELMAAVAVMTMAGMTVGLVR